MASLCPLGKNESMVLKGGYPPKPLLIGLQTIEEAKLQGASLQQTLC